MAVVTMVLPDRYPFVVAAAMSTFCVSIWQSLLVSSYRKKAGIAYPQAYAEKTQADASVDAMKFNCAQRAHQNTIEHIAHFLLGIFVTGVRYPTVAAVLGFSFSLGRVMYTLGYSSGTPDNRFKNGGVVALVSNSCIVLASLWTTGEMIWDYFN
ncbi:membrane-associated proteins in eicosanoid and glutathione metabolism [Rickenella mellea]|uniref:Membrane-associated proteins in eicosanoid and glutathione metabolism n=1 Tax=Rickenella mellea TaxID=50990 RepID=A0A4Y7Q126_9AGAM|nr:membrane-associated proteins in eicosanoid and glutathione metabolism [Rickenella mellea]